MSSNGPNAITFIGAVIPPNEALSEGIDLGGMKLMALEIPTSFNGTQITVQAKVVRFNDEGVVPPGELWRNVYDDLGNEVVITVGNNRIVGIDASAGALASLRFIRLRSGTSAAPVNQNLSRPIRLILKS